MKIQVITLTQNRLEYTKHCFKRLEEKAGYPYKHLVIDNGSTDGTQEWLDKGIMFGRNKGITYGLKTASKVIDKCDLVIKFDNDCEVITDNILAKIAEFYKEHNGYVVSPKIHGLNNPPKGKKTGNWEELDMLGGIFRVTTYDVFMDMADKLDCMRDSDQVEYFKQNNLHIGYLLDLEANHYETTNGQIKRFGNDYHKDYKY